MLKNRIVLFTICLLSSYLVMAQKNITEVQFEKDKIILNGKKAFDYRKEGNNYAILDLKGNELITGEIRKNDKGKWFSIITFKMVDKTFSNKKIIGRNHLIFALAEENVFQKNLKINKEKLLEFIQKYNELDK
ncbi:hypothetical protein C8N46_103393 [Kordia periserrulae]|uniref:Uncharacterized protein n=2 Tax=Kordia periserrulae TaxID=701523 RepID=A0A2T6C1W0_9FLAO|nr:hypothetical protein C8N46_103393 [Kordia periserrulae]